MSLFVMPPYATHHYGVRGRASGVSSPVDCALGRATGITERSPHKTWS